MILKNKDGEAFHIKMEGNFDFDKTKSVLENLPKNIIRSKGVFSSGVSYYIFNTVGNRTTFDQADNHTNFHKNLFIFIGFSIKNLESEIDKNLKKCLN